MAKIYANRIIAGTRTYNEVPSTWKNLVKALLKAAVLEGRFSAENYEIQVGEPFEE